MFRFALVLLGGCSLYFKEPPPQKTPINEDVDASVIEPDASTCPKPGTYGEILYPLDGATNVVQPVPIKSHVVIPNTLDGKGMYLADANGNYVDLMTYYDADCSISPPPIETGPGQDQTWTECANHLQPNTLYTWHVWLTCYDASGPHELATATFRTAP